MDEGQEKGKGEKSFRVEWRTKDAVRARLCKFVLQDTSHCRTNIPQYILIDNSKHMKQHKEDVMKSVKALSYLFKKLDLDGFEIANTSSPGVTVRCKTSTDASNFVIKTFEDGKEHDCMIEEALEAVLGRVKDKWKPSRYNNPVFRGIASRTKPSRRGDSVFIFTNGVWDHNTGTCGAERPIQSLITQMRENYIGRTKVSIQFIRIGSDSRGQQRLTVLDDDLPQWSGNEN